MPAPGRALCGQGQGFRCTKLINIATLQIPSCAPAHTSAINNPPRAVVWLAGRIVCNSRARPASKSVRDRVAKLSIVPATGLHSEKQDGFRRVPSKQGPPKGSFLNFLSSVSACAKCPPKVAFRSERKTHTVACSSERQPKALSSRSEARDLGFCQQLSCSRFPKRPSCGNHLEILWEAAIDRILRTTVC